MASEKAQRTKVALIEAANAIILEEGIDNLTLDRVAERAGLSKGALTYHFSSKRSLHAALIAHYVEHMNEEMEKYTSLFEGDDADRLVAGYVEWFKAFDRNNRGWATVGVTLISSFVHDKELMAPVTAWYEALYQRIERLPVEIPHFLSRILQPCQDRNSRLSLTQVFLAVSDSGNIFPNIHIHVEHI